MISVDFTVVKFSNGRGRKSVPFACLWSVQVMIMLFPFHQQRKINTTAPPRLITTLYFYLNQATANHCLVTKSQVQVQNRTYQYYIFSMSQSGDNKVSLSAKFSFPSGVSSEVEQSFDASNCKPAIIGLAPGVEAVKVRLWCCFTTSAATFFFFCQIIYSLKY